MRDDAALGLDHVAASREQEPHLLVGDEHHRLEPAQIPVGPPVLGQLDAGSGELARILLELALQPLEQGEGVGSRAGEAPDDAPLGEAAHLLGVALHDGLPERYLPVAADHHASALADHEDRGCVHQVGEASFMRRVGRREPSLKAQAAELVGPAAVAFAGPPC